jgi:hypothetical protein
MSKVAKHPMTFVLAMSLAFSSVGCDTRSTQTSQDRNQARSPARTIDPRIQSFLGGADAANILASPDKVEARRLDGWGDSTAPDDKASPLTKQALKGYKIIGAPVLVDGATRQRLIHDLLNPESYWFDAASACIPHWDVAYTFHQRDRELTVVFCLTCGIVEPFLDGKSSRGQTASYVSRGALETTRGVFPSDEELKQVKSPGER